MSQRMAGLIITFVGGGLVTLALDDTLGKKLLLVLGVAVMQVGYDLVCHLGAEEDEP